MAITSALCNTAKRDFLRGVHSTAHTYKLALYSTAATLGSGTTAYSTGVAGQVTGTGYTVGGKALTGLAITLSGSVGIMDFADPAWTSASFTARGGLLYNDSVAGKPSVAAYDFGQNYTATNGTFTVQLPVAGSTTALVRIA